MQQRKRSRTIYGRSRTWQHRPLIGRARTDAEIGLPHVLEGLLVIPPVLALIPRRVVHALLLEVTDASFMQAHPQRVSFPETHNSMLGSERLSLGGRIGRMCSSPGFPGRAAR